MIRRLSLASLSRRCWLSACTRRAWPRTEIQWWHAMPGALGDWVNDLAKQFNDSQKE